MNFQKNSQKQQIARNQKKKTTEDLFLEEVEEDEIKDNFNSDSRTPD